MTNPVLILTHNNLALTKRCVESVRAQDVPTEIMICDNGSSDGTPEWISALECMEDFASQNDGVSRGWNRGLSYLFGMEQAEHVLVIGNDTVLPPWFYQELAASAILYSMEEGVKIGFVTGVAVDSMEQISNCPEYKILTPNPDFSAFLISRRVWEAVGPFDESMAMYAQDCDYHVRAHKAGIPLMKASVPYYHERSSTLRLAPLQEKRQIQEQANRDRATFRAKYGCIPGEPAYEELFK